MSDEKWQTDIREKIENLVVTLAASNNIWNAWELEFIESLAFKLEGKTISVSPKQYEKICDLWDKI